MPPRSFDPRPEAVFTNSGFLAIASVKRTVRVSKGDDRVLRAKLPACDVSEVSRS